MKKIILSITAIATILIAACNSSDSKTKSAESVQDSTLSKSSAQAKTEEVAQTVNHDGKKIADAATILARKQVPVLCYHQIRDWTAKDSKSAKDYIIPVQTFKEHIKMLADSGYHSIQPDQYYNYLAYGDALPAKPVMLTFDDTDYDQFEVGNKELKKYGFKGVYFIMTVSIGKNGKYRYMSKADIKELSDEGNTIGSHTYDHQNVKKLVGDDWTKQIDKPTKVLEDITGKKIDHFAYPFGLWNKEAIPELKKRGFRDAYILSTSRDEKDPLFTIRRIIASGYWSARTLHNSMKNSF
ncbi:polysaccharide deacetylase family protein [Pedobacter sp. SD-b]|uniref:Polysaccharide deacetylase family protein n=1 Tax=Pedobacter segetis TaxID=2793069 RepID=A0ABS1BN73_9SPHI|nr:polysaccharide deacetylase family protein [Pedobacter segetis]MBK0384347.1 polysaccharide deacetylase family protein [Pedobacter segetis]